ncbi:unnamed protein product [Symbiodinium pilosum]|uniref:Sulfotransferase domain-containing protein n=1 Tax=Symbiodinium pilosum TaxID=2952 RepID=A0A812XYG2_SYMPI|nr:unnamed protein product [Symbiodinium pilosum]
MPCLPAIVTLHVLLQVSGLPDRYALGDACLDGACAGTALMQVRMAQMGPKPEKEVAQAKDTGSPETEPTRRIMFLHIPKTAGTSFVADAMLMVPSSVAFLDNGELSLLGTPHFRNETRVVMLRNPLDHVLSQFLECKFDWWGKRVTAGTDFPFKPGVYGGLDEWVHHFTNLKNTSVLGFEPDSKEWARAVSHNCYNPWNMQSRYLASTWDHYVPFSELQPDIEAARKSLQGVQVVGVPELYVESLCLVHLETHGHLPKSCTCGQQGPLAQISTESHYVPNHTISDLPDNLLAEMAKLVQVDAQIYVDALNRFEAAVRLASDRTGIKMFCEDRLEQAWENANSLLRRLHLDKESELQRMWGHVHVEVVATAAKQPGDQSKHQS